MLGFLVATALAGGDGCPATVEAGVGAVAGPALATGVSAGGYGFMRLVLWANPDWGVEFGAREGYVADDGRMLGAIALGARWSPPGVVYARAGFVHHHETPYDVVLAHPIGSALGSAVGIRHRTGLEIAAGVDVPVAKHLLDGRLSYVAEVSLSVLPDSAGPPVYVFVDQAVTVDVGQRHLKR